MNQKIVDQHFSNSPYMTKERIQVNNQKKKQYQFKQKTNSAVEDEQNNQPSSKQNNDDHQKQLKFEQEILKKTPKIQEIQIYPENMVYNKVTDQDVYINARNLNMKRQSLNQIQAVSKLLTESKVQNGSNKTHRIRKLNNLPIQNQELQSRDEEEKDDLTNNNNKQMNNEPMPALGLQLPQKAEELQKLKNNIIELKKQKQQILKFLKMADSRLQQNPLLFKKYLYRINSFDSSHKSQIDIQNDQKPLAIEQNINIKINRINLKDEEFHRLNALNKTILEENDILKNQIEEKEKQINNLDKHVQENTDIIQKLQNDLQVMNHQNTNLQQLIQNHVSDFTEQNRKIDQYKENIEKLNQELQNKDKNTEIEQLRFQINQEIEQKNNNLQIYHQEIEQLKLKLDEQRQENDQLNNNLSNLNLEIQELKQQNEDQNNKNLEYNQTINNLNQEIINIQANLDIKDQNIQELTRIIDKSNQEIQQLTQDKQQLNQEVQQLTQDKEQLTQDKEQINQDKEQLNQDKQQLNQDKEQLNQEKQQLTQDKEKLNQDIQQQNQDNSKLNQEIQQLNQKIQQQNKVINEKEDKILNLQLDLELYQYSNKTISLLVKSVNSNRSETIQVKLKDSINDVYFMAIQRGIQIQLTPNTLFFVPSKNKRIIQTDWNQKFYQIFIPSDYNQTIIIEFNN